MDFTVVDPAHSRTSPPTAEGLVRRRSSGTGASSGGTSYSSKSLERPRKQKIARQASPGSGTASVIKSLSVGKSVASGLNQLQSDPVTAYDSEENMMDAEYTPPPLSPQLVGRSTPPHQPLDRSMTSEPYYHHSHLSAGPVLRSRTSTSPASMMDSRLNRNSHLADSCRTALKDGSVHIPSTQNTYPKRIQQCRQAIDEIVNTERTYVLLLNDILKGYREPLNVKMHELPISVANATILFGEIMEIRNFNKVLLDAVEKCGHDLHLLGECFLRTWGQGEGCEVYSKYCTKYPLAVEVYSNCIHNSIMLEFFKKCQHNIRHPLPLGSDLLEPVQRVLRYHILLKRILSNLRPGEDGYSEVKTAHETMTGVAEQINEMKRKHEDTVHVQVVQSQLVGWSHDDLTTYGDLTREDSFKYYLGRGAHIPFRGTEDRYVFLFKKLILLTKRREDVYKYKGHISWTDLQLIETLERYPNSFQVKQLSTGIIHTFHAKSDVVKSAWVVAIKKMIVESIPALSQRRYTRDLLVTGSKKDIVANDSQGYNKDRFSTSSSSMHSLDQIRSEQSPKGPRIGNNSWTTRSARTLPKGFLEKKSADDACLPNDPHSNRDSIVSDNGSYSEEPPSLNGVAMETPPTMTTPQDSRQLPALSHSRSAVLSKPLPLDTPHRMSRNLSDSSVLEGKRSSSPTDSLYSSDSVASSLDLLEQGAESRGGVRGTSPSVLDPADQPPGSPQLQMARTRSSARRRKARPTSFAETDDIPEDGVLHNSWSAAAFSQALGQTRSESAEPTRQANRQGNGTNHISHRGNGVVGVSPDPMLASLDNLGDSLMQEIMGATPPTATATPSTRTPTPGSSSLRRQPSNELGQELRVDLQHRYEKSPIRRETLEQDLQTTNFDETINLSPPTHGTPSTRDGSAVNDRSVSRPSTDNGEVFSPPATEDPLGKTVSATSVTSMEQYILAPPDAFGNSDAGISTSSSEPFFTPTSSPLPVQSSSSQQQPPHIPSCQVAAEPNQKGSPGGVNSSVADVSGFDPSSLVKRVSMAFSDAVSDDPSLKRSSVALSVSSVGSGDSPQGEFNEESTTSTPEPLRTRPLHNIKTRPISTCSTDSLSSDGSPGGFRRKSPGQGNPLDLGISQLAVTGSNASDLAYIPQVTVRSHDDEMFYTGDESPSIPTSKSESTVSKLLSDMGINSRHKSEKESDQMSLDEILPYLDECAAERMSTPPLPKTPPTKRKSPLLLGKSSVPFIVVDSVTNEVKRKSKSSKKSPRMSPMRRHTTSDFAAALEEERREKRSPSTRVKKIARDYSQRLKDKGKMARFQSFTARPGYTALGESPAASPQIPHWKKEIKDIQGGVIAQLEGGGDSDEEGPSPSHPPWLEEAKRVRELRKTQTSPSASSYDSVESAPSKLEGKHPRRNPSSDHEVRSLDLPLHSASEPISQPLPAAVPSSRQPNIVAKVTSPVDPASPDPTAAQSTAATSRKLSCPLPEPRPPGKGMTRSRLSLSPNEYGNLFHIREMSKSSEHLPRSLSAGEVRPTFFSPRQARSGKNFLRASNSPSARRSSSTESQGEGQGENPVDFERIGRRGGFKGFVKNIVDRFSGRNH